MRTDIHPLYAEIGKRIRAEREAIGFTQTELAFEAGLKRAISISEYEDGKVRVSIETLYRIAEAMGISLACLLPEIRYPKFPLLQEHYEQMTPGAMRNTKPRVEVRP